MIFGPELIKKVLSGEKTVTRRPVPARYRVGRVYAVQPGRGKHHVAHIKALGVREEPLSGVLKLGELRREGLSGSDFIDYWEKLHGPIDLIERVTRIEFELAPSCPDCSEPS